MKIFGWAVGLWALSAGISCAAESPLANAKVGDWAEYQITSKYGGVVTTADHRDEVIARNGDDITIETTAKLGNSDIKNSRSMKAGAAFEPFRMLHQTESLLRVKELATGEEPLNVNGKVIKTTWIEADVTSKHGAREVTEKSKVWIAADVPLGVVKLESGKGKSVIVLTKFGRK